MTLLVSLCIVTGLFLYLLAAGQTFQFLRSRKLDAFFSSEKSAQLWSLFWPVLWVLLFFLWVAFDLMARNDSIRWVLSLTVLISICWTVTLLYLVWG